MTRTLMIGGNSGIGLTTAELIGPVDLYTPEVHELDVRSDFSVNNYLGDRQEFDEVVYCAGIQVIESIGRLSSAALDIIDVNYIGFLRVINRLAQEQPEHPTSIVAIVSDASRVAMRGSIAYCSSKAALAHAIRCTAREMAPHWRVNGVSPGVVEDTPMTAYIDETVPKIRKWSPEKARDYERSMIPMGRRGRKYEVARVIESVLRGPEYMTGSIVEITGGK